MKQPGKRSGDWKLLEAFSSLTELQSTFDLFESVFSFSLISEPPSDDGKHLLFPGLHQQHIVVILWVILLKVIQVRLIVLKTDVLKDTVYRLCLDMFISVDILLKFIQVRLLVLITELLWPLRCHFSCLLTYRDIIGFIFLKVIFVFETILLWHIRGPSSGVLPCMETIWGYSHQGDKVKAF